MDGVFSPEKNYTKISNFGEVVFILEHVMSGNAGFQCRIDKASYWIIAHNELWQAEVSFFQVKF